MYLVMLLLHQPLSLCPLSLQASLQHKQVPNDFQASINDLCPSLQALPILISDGSGVQVRDLFTLVQQVPPVVDCLPQERIAD